MQQGGELKKAMKGQQSSGGPSSAGGVDDLFASITGLLSEEMTSKVGAVYRFVLRGDQPGNWVVDIKNGPGLSFSSQRTIQMHSLLPSRKFWNVFHQNHFNIFNIPPPI